MKLRLTDKILTNFFVNKYILYVETNIYRSLRNIWPDPGHGDLSTAVTYAR